MKDKNIKWSNKVVDVLCNLGIKYACICPGSRNSPLTYAMTSSNIKCFSQIDERSASFFALGISKRTGKPTVVTSTSGTAVAEFFPAIIEASYSKTPLIIITADRPKEIVGTGANQTINQKNIFGDNVRIYSNIENTITNFDELDDLLQYFPLLKSRDKLKEQDSIWKYICKDLEWQYDSQLKKWIKKKYSTNL